MGREDSGASDCEIWLFISHSSRDAEYAKRLVKLVKSALNLSADRIRCTSVPGYKLAGGVSVEERLRVEVRESKVLLALISPNGLKSTWVTYELAARWGAEKPLLPLLAMGASASDLAGPLATVNVIDGNLDSGLHDLIDQLGDMLETETEGSSVYLEEIKALLECEIPREEKRRSSDGDPKSHEELLAALEKEHLEGETLLDLLETNQDKLISGVTNWPQRSDCNPFLFGKLGPRLIFHGVAKSKRMPKTVWWRLSLNKEGIDLLRNLPRGKG